MKFLDSILKRDKGPKRERVDIQRRFDMSVPVGNGTMSQVYKAFDQLSQRTVALKVLDLKKSKRLNEKLDAMRIERPSEGEIALQLKHPHIVNTIEFGWSMDDEQFLVMEFVEGVHLTLMLDTGSEDLQKHRLEYIIQIGDALSYFHAQGFIHRDLCPKNILIDNDRQVKLIDFGLALPNTPAAQQPGNRTGTLNYMAPELILRRRTDQRIDLFSFAITCYQIYANKYPWDTALKLDAAVQAANKPPNDIRDHVEDMDDQVAETIMRGLKAAPDDRWQTATEMVAQFRDASERLVDKAMDDAEATGADVGAQANTESPEHAEKYIRKCLKFSYKEHREDRTRKADDSFQAIHDAMDDANFEQAANLAREAIADFQDLHYLYDWAGTAYLRMKDYDRAREFLLQGLSKSKKKHPLCRTLGEVEWRCKDMPEALYWWAQTIHGFHASRDRNDHGVYLYLHYVADGLVMSELAQKFLQRADQIRSGEIRLIPAAADSLRSQSRAQGTKSMARVLSELAKHYLAGRRKKSRE